MTSFLYSHYKLLLSCYTICYDFRESLAKVEARIAEEKAKKKELERKRAEGEVGKDR